jgi:hypothetical protein
MATMTFQNGGYFGFKVIELRKDLGDPLFLFQKILLLSILNYFVDLKKFYHAKSTFLLIIAFS